MPTNATWNWGGLQLPFLYSTRPRESDAHYRAYSVAGLSDCGYKVGHVSLFPRLTRSGSAASPASLVQIVPYFAFSHRRRTAFETYSMSTREITKFGGAFVSGKRVEAETCLSGPADRVEIRPAPDPIIWLEIRLLRPAPIPLRVASMRPD